LVSPLYIRIRAAQIFEILGLNKILLLNILHIPSRIEGIGLIEVEKKLKKISESISKLECQLLSLEIGGIQMEKNRGEAYV
jgi:glutamate synthase (ferredoxin)